MMRLLFAQPREPKHRMESALVGSALLLSLVSAAVLPVSAATPGTLVVWGDNSYEQRTVPAGLSGVTAIAAGYRHIVAVKNDGTVAAWGDNTFGGTTGTPNSGPPFIATANPVMLNGQTLNGVTAIAAGDGHTVALKDDGTVAAWGYNEFGQTTGIPSTSAYPFSATANPVTLSGQVLNGVKSVSAGLNHTLALKTNGTVMAWGNNVFGLTTIPAGLGGVTAVAAGRWHNVVLKNDGTVIAWGYNGYGQTTIPAGLSGVTAIAAGMYHSAALKSDGTVVAWGYNGDGQTTVPAGLNSVTSIAAGVAHTVALKSSGTVVAWGGTGSGEAIIPAGLSGVTAIAAGNYYTVAIGGLSPIITTQPVGATLNVGQGASFSVANTGTAPMSYQWRKDGVDVFGASSTTLALSNVQTNQAGNYAVVITNAFGSVTSSVVALAVNRLVQTVSFGSLLAKRVDDVPFNLNATTSSGLPVSYSSSAPGVASVSGNTVTILGSGSTSITASQPGDATYLPAASVSQTLMVNRLVQAITFGPLSPKQLGDAPFTLNAMASSGLPVSYSSSNPSVATISGTTVTITGIGSTSITASQAGNATYLPATSVSQTLVIVDATITSQPQGQSFTLGGGATLSVSATGTGLTYQWQLNGTNIPGATGSTLNLVNLTSTNAGTYRVVVSSSAGGSVTSQNANLLFFGDLQFIASTILAGPVSQQFRVDYADVVSVGTTNWLTLTNVTLPYSPFLVIDPNSAGRTQRYYRAVPLP